MKPVIKSAVIHGKKYDTETATLLAGDDWWDGHNHERGGTNAFLYRTPRGRYFLLQLSQWDGSRTHIEPIGAEQAQEFFEHCCQHDTERVSYHDAFPLVQVEEA